jgi:peptidoglycan/LPS O-acetylase OafA/YrhL
LFYAFTLCIPLLYIFFGLKKRDRLLLVTGLLALAFSIYTYKHYFSWLTVSQELTLAGALLIALAGIVIRYLRQPRYGISDEPARQRRFSDLEALVAAQVIQQPAPQDGINFGGGNFGGGGAGERY